MKQLCITLRYTVAYWYSQNSVKPKFVGREGICSVENSLETNGMQNW